MARAIDSEVAYRFLTEQLVEETGGFSKGVNKGLNIARSAMRNPDAIPTLTPPNEWVRVEERLPEDEARQYIGDDLDGIGYLYPCLLTFKSPNTERIHVVRFYYDIIKKWFVNNGEELCEKSRCIAWMQLPAPYDRRTRTISVPTEKWKNEQT